MLFTPIYLPLCFVRFFADLKAAPDAQLLSNGQMVAYTIVLLILLVAGIILWKRATAGTLRIGKDQKLKILEMRMLGSKQYLTVVEYDGDKMLLGVSPGIIQHLGYLGAAENTRPRPDAPEFETVLSAKVDLSDQPSYSR